MEKTTIAKTISLKKQLVKDIETLSEKENRTFSNMAETLMLIGLKKSKLQI
nr:hypothetical protein [uncultured Allomuricauda sp.]